MFNALLWLRRPREPIDIQNVDGVLRQKGIESVPDPFGAGAYTASDNALRRKSGLVHETTT